MKALTRQMLIPGFLLTLILVSSTGILALQSPSKTAPEQSLFDREVELAKIQALVDEPEIAQILTRNGLTTEEAHLRLARLSPDEIHNLSTQVNQIHAAGAAVPKYIWILLAVLLGVLILSAIL